MKIPEKYDSIRPYEPEELPEVYERLIADEQFKAVVGKVITQVPFAASAAKLKQCKTDLDFQSGGCCPCPYR